MVVIMDCIFTIFSIMNTVKIGYHDRTILVDCVYSQVSIIGVGYEIIVLKRHTGDMMPGYWESDFYFVFFTKF